MVSSSNSCTVTYNNKPFIIVKTQPVLDAYSVAKKTATNLSQKVVDYVGGLDSSEVAHVFCTATALSAAVGGRPSFLFELHLASALAGFYGVVKARAEGCFVKERAVFSVGVSINLIAVAAAEVAKKATGYNLLMGAVQLGVAATRHIQNPFGFEVNS